MSTLKAYYAHTGTCRQERYPLKSYYMSDYALNMGDYPWNFMPGAGDKSSQSHTPTHTSRVKQRQRERFDLVLTYASSDLMTSRQFQQVCLTHTSTCLLSPDQAFKCHCIHVCISLFARKMYLTWFIYVYISTFSFWKGWTGGRQQRGDSGKRLSLRQDVSWVNVQ